MMRYLLGLTTASAMVACASASGTAGQERCALTAADSVYLMAGPVYRDCAVERRAWLVDHSARPEFHPSTPPPGGKACYSADVEFVVDTAGVPEQGTATLVHTNNPDYAAAVAAVVPQWRYRPATINGLPVRQIVRSKEGLWEVVVAVPVGESPRPGRPPTC